MGLLSRHIRGQWVPGFHVLFPSPTLVLELSPFRTSWWSSHTSRPLQGTWHNTASPSLGCQQEGSRPLFTVETRLPFMFKVKAPVLGMARNALQGCFLSLPFATSLYTPDTSGATPLSPGESACSRVSPSSGLTLLALVCQANSYTYLGALLWVSCISMLHEYPGWSWLLSLLSPCSTLSTCFCGNVSSDFFESLFLCLNFLLRAGQVLTHDGALVPDSTQ